MIEGCTMAIVGHVLIHNASQTSDRPGTRSTGRQECSLKWRFGFAGMCRFAQTLILSVLMKVNRNVLGSGALWMLGRLRSEFAFIAVSCLFGDRLHERGGSGIRDEPYHKRRPFQFALKYLGKVYANAEVTLTGNISVHIHMYEGYFGSHAQGTTCLG